MMQIPAPRLADGPSLTDGHGRRIDYLRVSVTDRCDFRCVYCMSERPTFLPKAEVLSIEELDRLCTAFIAQGTRRLRLTGGEPLVRRGFLDLLQGLQRHLHSGALDEITLTTNGSRLAEMAGALHRYGVRRINVSVDTLDEAAFARITRGGDLNKVRAGIEAALAAGLKVKINTVALKDDNAAHIPALVAWAHGLGCDITLIETMPLGEIEEDRTNQYVSLAEVRQTLESFWTLTPIADKTAGPARYSRVEETGGRIGFITPLSHTFCDTCNRVRVTCTGELFMCLGQEDKVDLRAPLRAGPDDGPLIAAIALALANKPLSHDFVIDRHGAAPAVGRTMAHTGG